MQAACGDIQLILMLPPVPELLGKADLPVTVTTMPLDDRRLRAKESLEAQRKILPGVSY